MDASDRRTIIVVGLLGTAALIYWLWPKRGGLGDAALDREMAKKSLREEREAIKVYGERLYKAEDPRLKKALRHARKEEREHAAMFRPLTGPDLLKLIAVESQSPEEYARRAEAWASTESKAPTDKELALEYWRSSGGLTRIGPMMKMIRDARKQRQSVSLRRFQTLIEHHEGDDLDGLRRHVRDTRST